MDRRTQDDDEADASDWRALPPPAPGLRAVVVLPARNELLLLPGALRALRAALPEAGADVLVLANNCSDATAAAARAVAAEPGCPVHVRETRFAPARANVGHARRSLMDAAAARLEATGRGVGEHGVIANTDADSRVEPGWLRATLAAIDSGADAVGGRLLTLPGSAPPPAVARLQRLDDAYRLLRSRLESLIDPDPGDPWPRHHQHFGASLALRVGAYRRVGGLPRVAWLEDEALVQRLRLDDAVLRHSPDVRVRTSGRFDGRAPVGLAWQLREWSAQADAQRLPSVVDPAAEAAAWALRSRLRAAWRAERSGRVTALENDPAATFGRRWAAHDPLPPPQTAPVDSALPMLPLDAAIAELRRRIRERLSRPPAPQPPARQAISPHSRCAPPT